MDDAEDYAGLVLREAQLDGDEHVDPRLVCRQWPPNEGIGLFRAPKSLRWSELGERARVGEQWRIYVRADVDEPRRSHIIAHEIGHVVVDRFKLTPIDVEVWCNRTVC